MANCTEMRVVIERGGKRRRGKRKSERHGQWSQSGPSHYPRYGVTNCMTLDTVSRTVNRSHGNLGNAILEPEAKYQASPNVILLSQKTMKHLISGTIYCLDQSSVPILQCSKYLFLSSGLQVEGQA